MLSVRLSRRHALPLLCKVLGLGVVCGVITWTVRSGGVLDTRALAWLDAERILSGPELAEEPDTGI